MDLSESRRRGLLLVHRSSRRKVGALLLGALAAPALLTVATAENSATATGGTHQPALAFAEEQYSVPYFGRLWSDNPADQHGTFEETSTNRARYFAQVAVEQRGSGAAEPSFAVEGQSDDSVYQTCRPAGGCADVTVRATPRGRLYLHAARRGSDDAAYFTHLGGFSTRAVELSAADAGSALKVYREVEVDPPPQTAGCEDYAGATPEAFTCLFLRELLPPAQAAAADEEALRAELPKLVQDHADYRLVFAEEFNGAPPAADADGCRDGLSTLDPAVWNYYDACEDVDSRGEPCATVGGGVFAMGLSGYCGDGAIDGILIGTQGLFHMKYGYLEARYTFDLDQWPRVYNNYNMILHGGWNLVNLRDSYGVEVADAEDHLKTFPVEVDIMENTGLGEGSGQYVNWFLNDRSVPALTSSKPVRYCWYFAEPRAWVVMRRADYSTACRDGGSITVTRGIEWTPRGYRYFIKIEGVHDDFVVARAANISVKRRFGNGNLAYEGAAADQFFEHLVEGDPDSVLEQVAVGHLPLPLNLNTWGWWTKADHPYIRRRMKFDYVRVWQPQNHYADMEPVYQ